MSDIKALNIRISKELWVFLKRQSILKEKTMNAIIIECLEKLKKESKNKLTNNSTKV